MTHLIPAFRRQFDVHLDPDSPRVAAPMATILVKTNRASVLRNVGVRDRVRVGRESNELEPLSAFEFEFNVLNPNLMAPPRAASIL
jgi:hypothetical protein